MGRAGMGMLNRRSIEDAPRRCARRDGHMQAASRALKARQRPSLGISRTPASTLAHKSPPTGPTAYFSGPLALTAMAHSNTDATITLLAQRLQVLGEEGLKIQPATANPGAGAGRPAGPLAAPTRPARVFVGR